MMCGTLQNRELYTLHPILKWCVLKHWNLNTAIDMSSLVQNHSEGLFLTMCEDAFKFNWASLLKNIGPLWFNLPFSLMVLCITKIANEGVVGIVLRPMWKSLTALSGLKC